MLRQQFEVERGYDEEYTVHKVWVGYLFHEAHKAPREYGQPMYPDEEAGVEIEEVTLNDTPFELTEKEREDIEEKLHASHTEYVDPN